MTLIAGVWWVSQGRAQSLLGEQIYQEGIVLYEQGRFEEAYQKFRQYESQGLPDKEFYVYFAVSAARSGHSDMVPILQRGLKRFPGDADLTLLLIQFLAEKQQFRQAMDYLKQARENVVPKEYNQFMGLLNFNEGVLLYQQGKKQESVSYFRKAIQYQPDEPRFYRNLAIVLWEVGQKEEATRVLEDAARRFPENREVARLLVYYYDKMGNLKALGEKLETLAKKSGKLEDYLVLGQYYLYTRNDLKARQLFAMLEQKFPRARDVYTVPAKYYQNILQYEVADSILSRMEKRFPGDTLVCRLKAQNFEQMDKLAEAAAYWQKCVQRAPKRLDFHWNLLRMLEKTDSTAYFSHLARMDSLFPQPAVRLKIALEWFQHHRYREAQRILSQIEPQMNDNPLVLTYLGLCEQHLGRDSLALDYFRRAIEGENAPPEAYFALARDAFRRNEIKQSEFYFNIALELLLQRLQQSQTQVTTQLQQSNLAANQLRIDDVVSEYQNDEAYLKTQIQWYLKVHSPEKSELLLQQLLERYPRNVYLRLVLADLALEKKNWEQAEKYLDDALYLSPKNVEVLRRKLLLARIQADDRQTYRLYLNLLYYNLKDFTEVDFQELIRLAEVRGELQNLAQQMLILYRRHPNQALLKKYTERILRMIGDVELADKIAKPQPPVGINRFIPVRVAVRTER